MKTATDDVPHTTTLRASRLPRRRRPHRALRMIRCAALLCALLAYIDPVRCERVTKRCLKRKKRLTKRYAKCARKMSGDGGRGERGKQGKDGGIATDGKGADDRKKGCGGRGAGGAGGTNCLPNVGDEDMDGLFVLCYMADLDAKRCGKFTGAYLNKVAAAARRRSANVDPEKEEEEEPAPATNLRLMGSVIPFEIRTFDSSVIDGYTECPELEEDIAEALKRLADSHIRDQANNEQYKWYRGGPGDVVVLEMDEEAVPLAEEDAKGADGAEGGEENIDEDSFKTNVQEEGVDEGDLVKSDGTTVFAGYGGTVVCWDAVTGVELCHTEMPLPPKIEATKCNIFSGFVSEPWAQINALLLHGDRLTVVVTRHGGGETYCENHADYPILSDWGTMQIRIYDVSEGAMPSCQPGSDRLGNQCELVLLKAYDVDGSYMASRSIGSNAHVVTASGVNYWTFTESLSWWNYPNLDKEEYIKAAKADALKSIPGYSRRLAEELVGEGTDCSGANINIMKIASFETGGEAANSSMPDLTDGQGILNKFVRIHSFDMGRAFEEDEAEEVGISMCGSFLPTHYAIVYASQRVMVLGGQGYANMGGQQPFGSWSQYTYLLAFALQSDGTAAQGLAVGQVPGYMLEQFAMDEHDGHLRVATTSRERRECADSEGDFFWWCSDWKVVSNSTSQVSILKFPEPDDDSKVMEKVSEITGLGETEEIKAVRFFDDYAFVVTFLRTDPLYTIDLSDHTNPQVKDELKITGFAQYLHLIEQEGDKLLLGVGQEADEKTGRPTGLQISLFNVSDLTDISLMDRYTFEDSDGVFSRSDAEHDHRAFRFMTKSRMLLVPADVRGREVKPFDGFFVFRVTADDGIEYLMDVNMVESKDIVYGCWPRFRMPSRTLVFKGDATFIKGHKYESYELGTKEFRWGLRLDGDRAEAKDDFRCYGYWG